MNFGKNRVQYNEFDWQFFRFDKFDTYFYVGGKEIAINTSKIAKVEIKKTEQFFDYKLNNRIIFLIYNKLTEFTQSNLGLVTGNEQYNIGGTTQIEGNKVSIYFNGNYQDLKVQIKAAIVQVLLNEMIYGSEFKSKLANNTLINLPEWYMSGLISYLSSSWDVNIDDNVRNGILSGKYEKFNHLTGDDAVYAGHSIWAYIAAKYGKSVIPNIVYLTRISKSADNGFLYVLGKSIKYISYDWLNYYDKKYYEKDKKRNLPNENTNILKSKKERKYYQAKLSPDGDYIAFCENYMGKYKVRMGKIGEKYTKIIKHGHAIQQAVDYNMPLIAWHPTGKMLAIITEEKGSIWLNMYDLEDKKITKREIFNFQKITNFTYDNKGTSLIMSAVKNGKSDIYVYSLLANSANKITNDFAADETPFYVKQNNNIIFSSNRTTDSLEQNLFDVKSSTKNDLFLYDLNSNSNNLINLSKSQYINENQSEFIDNKNFIFLSDSNGIVNRFIAKQDSSVSFVDTTIHYRHFIRTKPLTNYKTNILESDFANNTNIDLLHYNDKYKIFRTELNKDTAIIQTNTSYKNYLISENEKLKINNDNKKNNIDTVKNVKQLKVLTDTNDININNYVFDIEENKLSGNFPLDNISQNNNKEKNTFLKQRYYQTAFYTNYIVNQVDFGFLNTSYQAYTGSAVYFNPGFNLLFKLGANDLFEDYKIVGGFRFSGNLQSNEYLISFENLKSRIDKQYVFHRQAYSTISNNQIIKSHSHELMYILKYPFSQVSAIQSTASLRYDRDVKLSTDIQSLYDENIYRAWGGLKLEYIYDDTRNIALNIYNGTRFKIFGEAYQQAIFKNTNLFVLGADFRHYQKISRNFIWASRIAGSSSFGKSKLLYYLGGVDNWMNLSQKVPMFDQSVQVDNKENYEYQTLATNMRGFTQNIRNGSNFAVINNELRLPIVRYFSTTPINSDFLDNFQVVLFNDIGTAWAGKSPYDKNNAYNFETYENGPITVVIDKQKSPIVWGYGFGLRSRLLGYFVRADWAWGVEGDVILPRIFYLSLSLDF